MVFEGKFQENQNQSEVEHNDEDSSLNNQTVLQQFVTDVTCNKNTTVCITEENDVYMWGKNILESVTTLIDDPIILCKVDDHSLSDSFDNEGRSFLK